MQNYTEENLKKLQEIREKTPTASHVYMRRCDKDNLAVDIPIGHAEMTIRNRPFWLLLTSNKQMDDEVEALFKDDPPEETLEVPPKPSEIEETKPKRKPGRSKKQVYEPQV